MMDASPGKNSRVISALEILEEAFHLLRCSPPALLTSYYLGAVPFVLGLLFFWADMSHGVNASGHLFPAAMAMTLLYLLMKCMHSDFTWRLQNRITGDQTRKPSVKQVARLIVLQSIYQPLGFIVLPVALLLTVPFGWCFAFFQNLTVFGLEDGEIKEKRRRAWRQALIWPVQNNLLLGVLLLFSTFVMVNLMVAAMMVPYLLKTIFGIETVFSRSGLYMMNTTFFMTLAAMTYLCVDPIIKAVYVLRCYYGEARKTGEDLVAQLRTARVKSNTVFPVMMIIAGILFAGTLAARAGTDPEPPAVKPGVTVEQLAEAVTDVMGRAEYTWRTPRDKPDEPPPSGFWFEFSQQIRDWIESASKWLEDVLEWIGDLIKKLFPRAGRDVGEPSGWSASGYAVLYILLAVGACAAIILIQRLLKSKKAGREERDLESLVVTTADLEDENVRADALPEEEWMAMARDLMKSGETRLAIRALYLAALSHLASAGLITVADYKSDREYERELCSRGREVRETATSFSRIKTVFEVAWYGMHGISQQGLDFFMENHRRVMAHADL